MNTITIMAHRFKNVDRNTPLLLPPELRDRVVGLKYSLGELEELHGRRVTSLVE